MIRRGGEKLPPIRKNLGQHFLNDPRILTRIVDALAPAADETIVEIGAGRGSMTELLRARSREGKGRLIAIEYDRALAAILTARYASDPHVQIVEADVLQTDFGALAGGPYALVGNVPYYITTPILFHALRPPRAERAVYLVQREVAQRMSADPGSKEYGALSVNLQALAHVETLFRIAAGSFTPTPKVESAVVRVTPRREAVVGRAEEAGYRVLVQSAFGMRRKQMRKVLRELRPMTIENAEAALSRAGIDPVARPETLSPQQFAALFRGLEKATSRDS